MSNTIICTALLTLAAALSVSLILLVNTAVAHYSTHLSQFAA